jgi:hypothetical protein
LEAVETIEILFCPVASVNETDVPLFTGTPPTLISEPTPVGVIDKVEVFESIKSV